MDRGKGKEQREESLRALLYDIRVECCMLLYVLFEILKICMCLCSSRASSRLRTR
jgi:hypothetical protein